MENLLKKLAAKIDHTALKPDTNIQTIEKLCKEAQEYTFASVCVLPSYVAYSRNLINNPQVKICTVIGFPLGATFTGSKLTESELSLDNGANELDMVINIAEMMNGNYKFVREDIESIVDLAHLNKAIVKVIVETCLLNHQQKIDICKIVSDAGADFIKTSTGFSSGGATIEDIVLMRENCRLDLKIKASGGIRTGQFALELIQNGADRIGASAGIAILEEAKYLDIKLLECLDPK